MKLALGIVTYNRLDLLKSCLDSIPSYLDIDIFIVINGDDSVTQTFLEKTHYQFQIVASQTPGSARNLTIDHFLKTNQYDIIGFCDDDIIFPKSYFKNLEKILMTKTWDVIGGPDQSYPNSSNFEEALGICQSGALASANTVKRHKKNEQSIQRVDEKSLILCALWFNSQIFKAGYKFNTNYFRNEENVLLYELERGNYNIGYSSDLYVFHKKKDNFINLFKAVSSSGYFRMKSFDEFPESSSLIYFVPLFFLIYLIILPFIFNKITLIPIALYILINITYSNWLALKNNKYRLISHIICINFSINVAYGFGFLRYILFKK